MQNKFSAIFGTASGRALIATFVIAGLQAIQGHFSGNVGADIATIISILGMIFHPVDMSAGKTVSN